MVSKSLNPLSLLLAGLGMCIALSAIAGSHSSSVAQTSSAANSATMKPTATAMKIDWVLKPTRQSLEREALITITDRSGNPVSNAKVTISLDMPSMPGAHHVPPVAATPTATPGRYTALLEPEMAGEWAARIEMSAPQRLKVHKKFHVD